MSPIGEAVYPRVNGKPDTQFDEDGVWKSGLRRDADSDETKAFMKLLDEEHKQSLAKAKADPKNKGKKVALGSKPYIVEEETNTVLFNFTMKAKIKDKKTGEIKDMRPTVFGPDGLPLDPAIRVGGGSTIQVAYGIGHTTFLDKKSKVLEAFVKLYLNAVMIHKLVEFGGNAASWGFAVQAAEDDTTGEDEETTDETDETTEEEGEEAADADF